MGAILNVPATGRRAGCAPTLSSDWLNRLPRTVSAVSRVVLFQQQMYVKPNLNRSRAGIPQYQDPDRTNGMAKRPPEHILFIHPPSKRLCRALVATQPLSTSPAAGVTSPSLPVLPGSRSRKRSYQFGSLDERTPEEASVGRKLTRESTSGCFSDRCSTNNAPTCSRTGPPSYTISSKISDTVSNLKRLQRLDYNASIAETRLATRWRHYRFISSSLGKGVIASQTSKKYKLTFNKKEFLIETD